MKFYKTIIISLLIFAAILQGIVIYKCKKIIKIQEEITNKQDILIKSIQERVERQKTMIEILRHRR